MSALETSDTNLLTKASEDSPAWGFRVSGGIWDRDGRGEREGGDDVIPLEPLLAVDDDDEANRLTESRCRSGGLVEERGRGLGEPILNRGVGLLEDDSLLEGGAVDFCDKAKRERERERERAAESAVAGRRVREPCETRILASAVDGRTLVLLSRATGKLGTLVRAVGG